MSSENVRSTIELRVNDSVHHLEVSADQTLLEVIREDLDLTGSKKACDNGECGSCIVMMNGKPTKSCLLAAKRADGKAVQTIEGLAPAAASMQPGDDMSILHPLQQAFLQHGATQCGFCIPGMIMKAATLLEKNSDPSRDEVAKSLSKNLCRCTGYTKIIDAVVYAAELIRTNETAPGFEVPTGRHVGISVARLDSPSTINGAAIYGADMKIPGMLHAKLLRSNVHHARIISIDTTDALAMPGVEAVVTAADVPGTPYLPNCQPQAQVFADSRIRFKGEALAAVAATSEKVAELALQKIKVTLEELPHAIDLDDAYSEDATPLWDGLPNISQTEEVGCGNVDAGFAEADVVVEHTYKVPVREHAAMEPESAVAYEEDGVLVLNTGLYHAFVQGTESIANNLAMPAESIRIACPAMGGNFGTRGDTLIAVVSGLLTRKTGKPVKIVFSRAESILGSCKAPSVNVRYKTGATRDGRIVAVDVEVIHGTGSWAPHLIDYTTKGVELCYYETLGALLSHITGPYQVPNVRARAIDVITNGPRYVPLRGTNANYLPLAYESQVDLIAEALGLDPITVREQSAVRNGSDTHIGQTLTESVSMLDELAALKPHYEQAKARVAQRRAEMTGPWLPGIGIGCGWRNIGYLNADVGAGAELEADGKIRILAGTVEQGQGPTTQFAQIAADAMGVAMNNIVVTIGDTAKAPYPVPTFSSITTVVTGRAVQMAAENLRLLIAKTAAKILKVGSENIETVGQQAQVIGAPDKSVDFKTIADYLSETGVSSRCEGLIQWNGEAPNILYGYNAGLMELDVNVDTGQVRLLNHVNVCDPGTLVNPQAVEGQVDGGIAFGVGFALKEAFHPDNPPTLEGYGLPTALDVPKDVTRLFVTEELERGPFGAKSMAEHPGISPIPAIINAIANATGARVRQIPATPDRVKIALAEHARQSNPEPIIAK